MNLRTIHLYLGCLFAPLLIVFVVTGALQTFNLHHSRKDGSYLVPKMIENLATVHVSQSWPKKNAKLTPSFAFKIFVLLMSVGFLISTILGIVLAFQHTKKRGWVWLCLFAGILIPVFFLWMARGF